MRAAKIGAICMGFILLISMSNVFGASVSDTGAEPMADNYVMAMANISMGKKSKLINRYAVICLFFALIVLLIFPFVRNNSEVDEYNANKLVSGTYLYGIPEEGTGEYITIEQNDRMGVYSQFSKVLHGDIINSEDNIYKVILGDNLEECYIVAFSKCVYLCKDNYVKKYNLVSNNVIYINPKE